MKDLTIKLTCSTQNYECMAGKCAECKNFMTKLQSMFLSESMIKQTDVEQWVVNGMPRREKLVVSVQELLTMFEDQFTSFRLHSYITNVQQKVFKQHRAENVRLS